MPIMPTDYTYRRIITKKEKAWRKKEMLKAEYARHVRTTWGR